MFKTLFPTTISQGLLPGAAALNRRLLTDIQLLSKQDSLGRDWSAENYKGGYTSYASLSDLHYRTPAFSDFAAKLQPQVESYAKELGWEMKGMRLEMTALWMNIMPRHVHHTLHLHPHSVVSGAYYVNAPAQSVALKLEDPRMGFYMNAPVRGPKAGKENQLYYHVVPRAGQFVLFESWLRHEVPPNQSLTPRISLSFNYSLEEKS